MRDIPFFTTENGAAGLTLQEVPYTGKAYITVHSTLDLESLLGQCKDFCRAVGARHVFACNHHDLVKYPVYCKILCMKVDTNNLPKGNVTLLPVTDESLPLFLRIYNEKMTDVPAAAYMTHNRGQELLKSKSGCFAYSGDDLVGIAMAEQGMIEAVASLRKDAGRDVVCALCKRMGTDEVCLDVADTNIKAVALYESLGFTVSEVKNIWHQIL